MADTHHEHPPEDPAVCRRVGVFLVAVLALVVLLACYN